MFLSGHRVSEDGVDDVETHRSNIGLYLYISEVHLFVMHEQFN